MSAVVAGDLGIVTVSVLFPVHLPVCLAATTNGQDLMPTVTLFGDILSWILTK